ncbi:MAG: hypothetical protein HYX48_02500 [Chlamydiales bacterium]|nr:hypothetical protein [Chlamydiales bacterium]
MVFNVIESRDYNNPIMTPFAVSGMIWVTEDFLHPMEQAKDAKGDLKVRVVPIRNHENKIVSSRNEPIMERAEMGCLESMTRRVIGALCYAALAVAVEVELVVRAALTLVLIPIRIAYACLCDNCDFTGVLQFLDILFIKDIGLAIDAPVRAISGIVQKCLLNLENKWGDPKEFDDLALFC